VSASQETGLPEGLSAALRFHECILAGDVDVQHNWSHYRHATWQGLREILPSVRSRLEADAIPSLDGVNYPKASGLGGTARQN
jgi:hypothetical protein